MGKNGEAIYIYLLRSRVLGVVREYVGTIHENALLKRSRAVSKNGRLHTMQEAAYLCNGAVSEKSTQIFDLRCPLT